MTSKNVLLIGLLLSFSVAGFAKSEERAPSQYPGYPAFPSQPSPVDPGAGAPVGTFSSEDVVAAGAIVTGVSCHFNGPSPTTLSGVTGNDVRVTRVSSGGDIRYEVRKGQRFVAACNMVQVSGR